MQKIKKKLRGKSGLDIVKKVVEAALDKKAEDLVVLDVRGISSFADYFVIMSGNSTRHTQGIATAVEGELANKRINTGKAEGLSEGHWILLDYSDVVVHVFYKEMRKFYDLEGLWHDAPRVIPAAEPQPAAPGSPRH